MLLQIRFCQCQQSCCHSWFHAGCHIISAVVKPVIRQSIQLKQRYKSTLTVLQQTNFNFIVGSRIDQLSCKSLLNGCCCLSGKTAPILKSHSAGHTDPKIERCFSLMCLCKDLQQIRTCQLRCQGFRFRRQDMFLCLCMNDKKQFLKRTDLHRIFKIRYYGTDSGFQYFFLSGHLLCQQIPKCRQC